VGVAVGSEGCSDNGVEYHYTSDPAVDAIHPSVGHTLGGAASPVTIVGKFFEQRAICKFDDLVTSATLMSSTEVHCIAPSHVSGNVSVTVSNDGTSASEGVRFLYVDKAILQKVQPSRGPVIGGFKMTIVGAGFPGAIADGAEDAAELGSRAGWYICDGGGREL